MNKRNILINFRLTDEELKNLNYKVKRTGMSREEFIREAIFNKIIHEAPPVDYNKFIFELRRVGQNLNRLLQIAYSNGLLDVPKIRTCLDEIRAIDKDIHAEFWGKN